MVGRSLDNYQQGPRVGAANDVPTDSGDQTPNDDMSADPRPAQQPSQAPRNVDDLDSRLANLTPLPDVSYPQFVKDTSVNPAKWYVRYKQKGGGWKKFQEVNIQPYKVSQGTRGAEKKGTITFASLSSDPTITWDTPPAPGSVPPQTDPNVPPQPSQAYAAELNRRLSALETKMKEKDARIVELEAEKAKPNEWGKKKEDWLVTPPRLAQGQLERNRAMWKALDMQQKGIIKEAEVLGYAETFRKQAEHEKQTPFWKKTMLGVLLGGVGVVALSPLVAMFPALAGIAGLAGIARGISSGIAGATAGVLAQKHFERKNYKHATLLGVMVGALAGTASFLVGKWVGGLMGIGTEGVLAPAEVDTPARETSAPSSNTPMKKNDYIPPTNVNPRNPHGIYYI